MHSSGYYPPDHSIVTGESNTLDSFEALMYGVLFYCIIDLTDSSFFRELAELIGQAKPPTASKEEIEKSGLEVIKASTVSQYETEKKISSNCTERVSIESPKLLPSTADTVLLVSHLSR